jgi:6-phosphogluconolactonase (cycloisomerase 2 family)
MKRFFKLLSILSILALSSCFLNASIVDKGLGESPSDGEIPDSEIPGTPGISDPASFVLSSITPSLSNTLGGVTVTLLGVGFTAGANVTIGGSPCTNVVIVSDIMVTCVSPALSVGIKDVVISQNSRQGTLIDGFTVSTVLGLVSASSGNILLFSHNASDGSLILRSSTSSSGSSPRGLHFTKGQRLYVINSGDAKVSAYSYEMADFSLTELPGSPYTVSNCVSMKGSAISPNYQYLYLTCETSNNFFVYNILSDGTLTFNSGPYPISQARSVNVHASGSMVFVTGYNTNSTDVFSVDINNGSLSTTSAFSLSGQSTNSTLFGDYFYAPRWGAGNVFQFGIQNASSIIPLNPVSVSTGSGSYSIGVSPDGKWANVPREATTGDLLDIFSRSNLTGQLTPIMSVNTGTTTNLRVSSYDPDSKYFYVVGNNSNLLGYSINQLTGVPTSLTGFPLSLGSNSNVYWISAK